ncbi:MAG TPA: prepilin peptidase [Rhodopila sp.]
MPLLFAILTLGLLGFAAWRDLATRTIPNQVSLALAVLGLAFRLTQGWPAALLSIAVAAALFVIMLLCHARGLIGGADVKLLTALALGLPPLGSYQLVAATALAGGVLAVLYILLRRTMGRAGVPVMRGRPHRFAALRVAAVELWRIRRHGPLPYGVAIAVGGALVVLTSQGS